MDKQNAIFLDRDGTLLKEVNFLSRVEDIEIFDFTASALRALKDAGYLLIVVTNQSGIGREIYTEADMHAIHDSMQTSFDGIIDAFYFCPHLPTDGCNCRKPGTGMFEVAASQFEIDFNGSWMIGDKQIDVEAGQNAGLRTALVLTGYGNEHQHSLQVEPTIIPEHFGCAATIILEQNKDQLRPKSSSMRTISSSPK